VDVYKRECREIIRRFLAKRISFPACISGAALADVFPRMSNVDILEIREILLSNNAIVMKEMERRGPLGENSQWPSAVA
jgi:hypothetical protein